MCSLTCWTAVSIGTSSFRVTSQFTVCFLLQKKRLLDKREDSRVLHESVTYSEEICFQRKKAYKDSDQGLFLDMLQGY